MTIQLPPDLTLRGILGRRFTVWRIGRITRQLRRQADLVERLWASVGCPTLRVADVFTLRPSKLSKCELNAVMRTVDR